MIEFSGTNQNQICLECGYGLAIAKFQFKHNGEDIAFYCLKCLTLLNLNIASRVYSVIQSNIQSNKDKPYG